MTDTATMPAYTPAELIDLVEQMCAVLARLDDFALSLPAGYVQLAVDHVRALLGD